MKLNYENFKHIIYIDKTSLLNTVKNNIDKNVFDIDKGAKILISFDKNINEWLVENFQEESLEGNWLYRGTSDSNMNVNAYRFRNEEDGKLFKNIWQGYADNYNLYIEEWCENEI